MLGQITITPLSEQDRLQSLPAMRLATPRLYKTSRGSCRPFGATARANGVNFAVFSRHAQVVHLVLFREGRDFALLPLPGLTHMVPDPVVNQRLYGRFALYFRKHLGRPEDVAKGP